MTIRNGQRPKRKTGRDLTQSYEKSPLYRQKKSQETAQRRDQILRLINDCGQSVALTAVIELVWLNLFTETLPSH